MAEQIIFYILAAVIIVCSLMAVTTQKIIRAATFLLFVLLGTAGLYLLLNYHFLMAVQIAVYAGGVMVLFIFAILLTNEPGRNIEFEKPGRMFIAALASLAGLAICGHIIFYNVNKFYTYITQDELQMQDIGMAMMGTDKYQYLLPFEAISILLLACIIGGIMIARKR
ncbi:NADH-quinone oxidoreductase subunit J [Dysgonomonas sp. PFB1-18]|uniref:NADH-quinone oxidoreductase subunit J family protein n=1 Tax=unclassified Dysgonomonas TaxID=2630389 RepID=UPI0024732270|nr:MULTISPECIES: NADH-quinone oxidoreductase subunit J [unclassified Dysgonomonas]MDH6310849.1 NADH-quinone oxidoreductase subunit J [Dysgonomonas sp. PF1-14]MDH6340713.1 NADH-quinone oxidoreductase subunit J [Dysgonomonas sp. PF1-16]MDH6382319.1 NADH-quinone oxidoreductase subunit J [Dysgonomonas sp. PFB1-18]MDH6399669.1 NADH-quinone oxidoreductase subunit J [Dysgonomonas sp. PF1-23]